MFIDKKQAGEILSKSSRTLNRYRSRGILIEGIHCAYVGNEWLYNEELLKDLITCGMNPNHPDHQRAIAYYQSQKLGNQLKGRQKKYQAT
ncbi:MAG: hypothetical protein KME19_11085 [Microcoleus vaginatus WJT46-NPBG5]|jgi:hypothetical protein|nr:hypothetical protein [Microcoleus vaginatus WJT46-NPBG5]